MAERKEQLKELLAKARELSSKDSPSEDEQKDLADTMVAAKSLAGKLATDAQIDEFTSGISEDAGAPRKDVHPDVYVGRDGRFGVFAERKGFDAAVKAWKSGQGAQAPWGFDVRYKDFPGSPLNPNMNGTVTSERDASEGVLRGTEDGNQNSGVVSPFYYPGIIEPPTRQPVVADLFAQGSTESNMVRLIRETVTVNGAKATAEGKPYGKSEIEVGPMDYPVKDVTTILAVTEDMLQDVSAMSSYLGMRLAKFVQLAEEAELLDGDGTGAHLLGISNTPGRTISAQGADNIATAVLKLTSKVYKKSFIDPTWVLMSPTSWATYASARTGSLGGVDTGEYLGGPPSLSAVRSVWGLPITVSPLVADDRIFVGNPAAAMVFRNGGLRVESSTGFGTFFGEGLVAIRGKVRSAFAVLRPQAIGELILGS